MYFLKKTRTATLTLSITLFFLAIVPLPLQGMEKEEETSRTNYLSKKSIIALGIAGIGLVSYYGYTAFKKLRANLALAQQLKESKPDENAIKVALQHGANPNIANCSGKTHLHQGLGYKGYTDETIKLLVKKGADLNIKNSCDSYSSGKKEKVKTPLEERCEYRIYSDEIIKFFLENGANPNTQNSLGQTLLHDAIRSQCSHEIITLLVEKGANPHISDSCSNAVEKAIE